MRGKGTLCRGKTFTNSWKEGWRETNRQIDNRQRTKENQKENKSEQYKNSRADITKDECVDMVAWGEVELWVNTEGA